MNENRRQHQNGASSQNAVGGGEDILARKAQNIKGVYTIHMSDTLFE